MGHEQEARPGSVPVWFCRGFRPRFRKAQLSPRGNASGLRFEWYDAAGEAKRQNAPYLGIGATLTEDLAGKTFLQGAISIGATIVKGSTSGRQGEAGRKTPAFLETRFGLGQEVGLGEEGSVGLRGTVGVAFRTNSRPDGSVLWVGQSVAQRALEGGPYAEFGVSF